jgi:hypothetical protein
MQRQVKLCIPIVTDLSAATGDFVSEVSVL